MNQGEFNESNTESFGSVHRNEACPLVCCGNPAGDQPEDDHRRPSELFPLAAEVSEDREAGWMDRAEDLNQSRVMRHEVLSGLVE
jgi:hypothetical protein